MRRIREASSHRNVRRGLIAALLAIPVVFIATTMPMQAMGTPVSPASTGTAFLTLGQEDNPDPVTEGGEVTYAVSVGVDAEQSTQDAQNVVVYDSLSQDVSYVSSEADFADCSYDSESHLVTCDFGNMFEDETQTAYITVQTTDNCSGGGDLVSFLSEPCTIYNDAEAYADNASNSGIFDEEDTTVNPAGSGALSLTKSDSPDPVQELNPITYTLNVRNNDEGNANNVVVSDDLPSGTTFSSVSTTQGSCSHTATAVTCNLGTLSPSGEGPGETVTIVVQAPNVTSDTTITNDASVSSSNAGSDTASANTTVLASDGTSAQGEVPPNSPTPLSFTTATVSTGSGAPAVNGSDPTTVILTVPPGGPGGSLTLDEIPCSTPPCTEASAVQSSAAVVLGNVVFDVEPPANYPHNKPFKVILLYDKTLNPGPGPVFYSKAGVTAGEIQLKACGSSGPGGKPPCVVNQKRIRGGSSLVKGDWRVVIKINSDPRMRK